MAYFTSIVLPEFPLNVSARLQNWPIIPRLYDLLLEECPDYSVAWINLKAKVLRKSTICTNY